MTSVVTFHCFDHGEALVREERGTDARASATLRCPQGCGFPVIDGIPRFVGSDNYAAAFGRQWNAFRKTQLDSYTGTEISKSRLARCLGGSLDITRGKFVLEAGCGAGRFTELLLGAGAKVLACDLSSAVEANRANCGDRPNYTVCQADITKLPVKPGQFDIVICLGVIQHTPDPEKTIAALCTQVKPGGLLVIDHYRYGPEDMTKMRQRLRSFLIRTSPTFSVPFIRAIVAALWPLHRLTWRMRKTSIGSALRRQLLVYSPVLDYHEPYGELGDKLLYAWAALDTHDALTDYYKHKRTVEQIAEYLRQCGMTNIEAEYGGNGVEARGTKPLGSETSHPQANAAAG